MWVQYESLESAFVDTKEHKVKELRYVSAIANRILRHNNDNEHAITEIKRDAYHPTFNYIWQIMEPALVESVGIPEKEQEKAVKAISFIDKVLHFFQPKKKKMQMKYPDLILPEEEKKE